MPNYEKAWRCITRSIIYGQKQNFKKMIDSYDTNDKQFLNKFKEFASGKNANKT